MKFWTASLIVVAIIFVTLGHQYLNFTGFCYAEKRYLSEHELIDRFLFSDAERALSATDKSRILKERNGASYPGCCRIVSKPAMWSDPYATVQKFIGNYSYGLIYRYPRPQAEVLQYDKDLPYEESVWVIDKCGSKKVFQASIWQSKDAYESDIQLNAQSWKEKQQ